MASSNLSPFSAVTDQAPMGPSYLNSKFSVLNGNINELNASGQSFDHLSMTTFSVIRSGVTGTFSIIPSKGLFLDSGAAVKYAADNKGQWGVNAQGVWRPGSSGLQIALAATPVRAIRVNHLASLATLANVAALSAGELGWVYQASGISLMARSGDTIYDLGTGGSLRSVAVV